MAPSCGWQTHGVFAFRLGTVTNHRTASTGLPSAGNRCTIAYPLFAKVFSVCPIYPKKHATSQ
jgi:hypothetical protein